MANLAQSVDKNDVINGGGKVPGIIAFIQAASFVTNTDWQSYEPEQMFTHFSQTVSTALHFLLLVEVGIAAAAVVVRGVARKQTTRHRQFLGRSDPQTLYLFLPICLVFAMLDVWQGIPMNFRPTRQATAVDQSTAASTTQPVIQTIVQGPMASYCAPKVLGLNGPGFTGADCAIRLRIRRRCRSSCSGCCSSRSLRDCLLLRADDQEHAARRGTSG
jgi:potassium-transporting ATPase potassium-binding subunit